jgi:predicted HAD superfamily hydrolase
MVGHLWDFIRRHDPAVISVDIFDTLLLRGLRPELSRFAVIARKQRRCLASMGVVAEHQALYRERLAAGLRAYDRARAGNGLVEARFEGIMEEVCHALALPLEVVTGLREVELNYESRAVRLNRGLAGCLAAAQAEGRSVVFTSDMYLSSGDIAELLQRAGSVLRPDRVYVSSDRQRTKRSGTLFDMLVAEEGLSPGNILHIGDHGHSDVVVPAARGLRVGHLPRGWVWRTVGGAAKSIVRADLRRRGLAP